MRAFWRPIATILLIAASTIFLTVPTPAAADTPFAPVFSTNAPGDIKFVSNTVATCSNAFANCAAAQSGAAWNNNNVSGNMILVDIDGDPTTPTSSSATYTLPPGGSVLWAGLYWSGYYEGPNGDKDDIRFETPTSGGYTNLTADQLYTSAVSDDFYGGFVDVTAAVAAGGSGTYTVGDISVTPNFFQTHGGWTLVVVEYDPAEPWKNLTVNQGFQTIGSTPSVTIPITGFTAPPNGPVNADIGVVASEGDSRSSGDFAEFNGVRLSDANNPSNNFFNSSLSDAGVYQTGSNPLYPANTLGYDADIIATSGLVPPGSTTADVTVGTSGDFFWPMVVTTAIEIFVPNLTTNLRKEAVDVNGEDLHPGDIIEYSVFFDNVGQDDAIDVVVSDPIPAGTTYIPGSLEVVQDDTPLGPRTDAAGDDTAWFDGSNVNFHIGDGATASDGGRIIPISEGGHEYEVSFEVVVDEGTEGTDIKNTAEIEYIADFVGEEFSAVSNETSQPVEALVDLTLDKVGPTEAVLAGEQLTYEIDITNEGPSPADNVVITDNLPTGTVFNASASDSGCSASGLVVTCSILTLAAGASDSIQIVVDVDGDITESEICNRASVASNTHEHDLDDNIDGACTEIEREVDLSLEKTAPATVAAGEQLTYIVTVSNDGPSDAQNVVIGDGLPSGLTLLSATPSGSGTCTGTVTCEWSQVDASSSESVTILVAVPADTADGATFTNRARTDSDDPEDDTSDNTAVAVTEVVTEADLALDKETMTSPVVAGESVTYALTVTNDGPSVAQNVVVSDPVPAGLTYVSSQSSTECSLAAGVVTCSTPTLNNGDDVSFTLVFDVDASLPDGASLVNTAAVSSDTDDPAPDNDKTQVTDSVIREADLSIVKDDNTTTVAAGGQITYTIDYRNDGPSDASAVSITDTLPTGATFIGSTACTASGSTVTCPLGAVADGSSNSVSYTVEVDSALPDTSQLENAASISGDESDPDPDDNDSYVTTDVERTSTLVIEKDDLVDPVVAGESTTYRIMVTNLGPSTDTDIVASDVLPAGTTYVSLTDPATCSHLSGTITCLIDTMAPGATFTVDIVVDIDADLPDGHIISNRATVEGDFSTLVDDVEETTVQTSADLAVTKTAPSTVVAGTSMTYAISVVNDGPSDALNTVIVDALPSGLTYLSHTVTQGTGSCNFAAPILTCSQPVLPSGQTIAIDVEVQVDASLADGSVVTNVAKTTSDTNDPDEDNNASPQDTTIIRQADLEVTKTTTTPSVLAGSAASFEVSVTNNGPSVASGVTVTDIAPGGFTFNSAGSDSACVSGVTCTVATDIPVGETVTFTVVLDIDPATTDGTYTNSVSATGNETDLDSLNDTATADVEVAAEADLAISKSSDTVAFVPGTTATYTITVENNGPSDATNIDVTDVLDSGLTFNSAGSDPACLESAGTVTCSISTLAASGQTALTLAVDIAADYTGDVVNTASVDSDTNDPDDSDNSSTNTTTSTPQADLSILKTAPTDVVAGETLTYTISVQNNGPSDATNTEVIDVLPAGLTFLPAGSNPQCSATGQTVTCDLATLAPSDVVTFSLATMVDPSVVHTTELINIAEVTSDTYDPAGADNTSQTETESSKEVDLAVDKSASVLTVVAGTSFTYTVVVTNAGPSDASNISISDTFPAGVTATDVTTDFGICGNVITGFGCSAPSMSPTDVMTITAIVEVDESVADGTTLTNTASASTVDPDTTPTNDDDSAEVTVETEADLSVEKVASVDEAVAGEPLSYTITVTNNGPSQAQDVALVDNVPAALSIDAVSSAEMTCTVSGQLVECDTASLADGATATVTIDTTVDEDVSDSASISNEVSVMSATGDPDEDNNVSFEQTGVVKLVDLELVKSTTKLVAVAGETHPYQLTVSNSGPSSATAIVVTDTLPDGTTLNATLSDVGCSAAGQTVTCTIAALGSGASASLNLVIDIPADYADGAMLTNTASVESDETDSNPDDNTDDAATPVTNSADLSIVKDADGLATSGLGYSWTLNLSNAGPSDAVNVIVDDSLPVGTSFDAALSDPRCSTVGQDVSCVIPVLASGATTDITVAVDIDSGVAAAADLENVASVSSDTEDPDLADNESVDTAVVERDSSLDISKSDITDPVVAGQQAQWEIVVDNLGPSDADNVTITDPLPAGFTFVSVDNTVNCSNNAGVVECLFPTIVEGASQTIIITADVASDIADTAVVTNTATANSDSSSQVSDDETTTVARVSDLRIEKTSDGAAVAGTNQTYTVTVTNDGPSDADNVTVIDYLPMGADFISSTLASCSAAGATVECDLGNLDNASTATFEIVVAISDAAGSAPRNVVEVSSDSLDPDLSNNTDDDVSAVSFEADLVISKSLTTDPVVPGTSAIWDIVVTNNGPSIATDVVAVDNLAAGLTFVAAGSNSACSALGQNVSCLDADLNPGETISFTIETDIDAALVGTLTNATAVTSSTPDPDERSNTSEVSGELVPQADLSVAKTSTTPTVTAGENVTYDVVVTNSGPSDAVNVVVSDPVPANTTFVPTLSSSNCSLVGSTVDCVVPVVPPGETASVALTFELATSYADGSTLTNAVAVSSDTPDLDVDNNDATDDTAVETSADLGVVKTGPASTVAAGEAFDYTITVTNDGQSDAQNVMITDTLAVGTSFVAVDDSSCSHLGGTVTCTYPSVANGEQLVVTITVLADSTLAEGSTVTNSVSVVSDTEDPNDTNNSDDQESTVQRTADLEVTKTVSSQQVVAGTELTYTLSVFNNGPANSDNVAVTDSLPAGTSFVSADLISGTPISGDPVSGDIGCVHDAGTVTCSAGSLDVGEHADFDVVVFVGADVSNTPSLVNAATATGANSPDSTETEEVEVVTEADLSLAKTLNGELVAGEEATYTLTLMNNGPSNAQNVVLSDALPSGLVYVSDTAGCDVSGAAVSCDLGVVANGTAVMRDITVMVEPWVVDGFTLTNNAGVESDTNDPDESNNTGSDQDSAGTEADLSITKSLDSQSLLAGEQATYTIEVTNAGPSDAQGVVITDELPVGLTFSSGESDDSCTGSTTVTCSLGVLAAGDTFGLTLAVDVDAAATGPIANSASVASQTPDPDGDNNTAQDTAEVTAIADVGLEKTLASDELTPGTEVDWAIEIENFGPATATDVSLSDILPSELTYVAHAVVSNAVSSDGVSDVGVSGDECSFDDPAVTCLFDAVEVGDVITLTITTLVDPDAEITEIQNTATVESPQLAESGISVAAEPIDLINADLVLNKVGPSTQVDEGDEFDWTITVRNAGPDPMTVPFAIVDQLPEGLSYVSHTVTSTGTATPVCEDLSGLLTCEVPSLSVDQLVTLVVTTQADETGTYENVATVEADFLVDSAPIEAAAAADIEARDSLVPEILALTGVELSVFAGFGSVAVVLGAGLIVASRRRRLET